MQIANTTTDSINGSKALISNNNQLLAGVFAKDRQHELMTLSNTEELVWRTKSFIRKYGSVVLKSAKTTNRDGLFICSSSEEVESIGDKIINESGYVLVSPLYNDGVKEDKRISKRIIATQKSIIKCCDRKYNLNLKLKHPNVCSSIPSNEQLDLVREIQQYMIKENLAYAEIDFIGNFVISVDIEHISINISEEDALKIVRCATKSNF